jgi:hypothetical protein
MNTDGQMHNGNNILQIKKEHIPRPSLVRNNNVYLDVKEIRLSGHDIKFYESIHIKIPKIEK